MADSRFLKFFNYILLVEGSTLMIRMIKAGKQNMALLRKELENVDTKVV